MFRKLLVFAITSGLAARLYKRYSRKQGGVSASDLDSGGTRRRASTWSGQ